MAAGIAPPKTIAAISGTPSWRPPPPPVLNVRQVFAILPNESVMVFEFCLQSHEDVRDLLCKTRNAGDGFNSKMIAVQLVQHGHVEGGRCRSLLHEAADMEVAVIGASVGQSMDEIGIPVIGKNHRLIARK